MLDSNAVRNRSILTVELQSVRSQLDAIQKVGVKGSSEAGVEIGSADDDDDAVIADDEAQENHSVNRQARNQQKKLSVFKDPKLKQAVRHLQVSSPLLPYLHV